MDRYCDSDSICEWCCAVHHCASLLSIVHRTGTRYVDRVTFVSPFMVTIVASFLHYRVRCALHLMYPGVLYLTSESNEPVFCVSRVLLARTMPVWTSRQSVTPSVSCYEKGSCMVQFVGIPFVRVNDHCATTRSHRGDFSRCLYVTNIIVCLIKIVQRSFVFFLSEPVWNAYKVIYVCVYSCPLFCATLDLL